MSEKFIPNVERDATIPVDVIQTIDAVYAEPDTTKRNEMLDHVLVFLRTIQKKYPREAVKQSVLFYKLSGGSVEDVPANAALADTVLEIDSAITAYVRGELQTYLES